MNLMELSSDGKIAYLIKPILKVLQEAAVSWSVPKSKSGLPTWMTK